MSGGNDDVVELNHMVYDASGNVLEQHSFEMNHDDTASVGIDMTANDYVRSSAYSWYDEADRLITMANYGSGDTAAGPGSWKYSSMPTRTGTPPTVSSDTELVTLYVYDAATGRQSTIEDPSGVVTKTFYDDLGRRIAVAENHVDYNDPTSNTNAGGGTDNEEDRVTRWALNGLGQTVTLTAVNVSGATTTAQETEYRFEDPVNASLATMTIYPDGDASSDNVQRTYHLDGSPDTMTDQRGVVHTYSYNNRRQMLVDDVGATGNGLGGSILAISRTYDNLGRLIQVSSEAASAPDNLVLLTYGSEGKVANSQQLNGSGTPTVQYAYDDEVDANSIYKNGLRLKNTTYPDGRVVHNTFGAAESVSDRLARAAEINQDNGGSPGVALASYQHNGTSRTVKVDYVQPNVHREMFSSGNDYDAWDRFGRVKRVIWSDSGTSASLDYYTYSYDYAGNRLSRRNQKLSSSGDQKYVYDGLHRLKIFEEGYLIGNNIAVQTRSNYQDWTLDQLGNWSGFNEDRDGDYTWDLEQRRNHNGANEIWRAFGDAINLQPGGAGPNWADPIHDAAGNMTTIPQPKDPTKKFDLKFDAWNRMVEVKDHNGVVVQRNEYDGFNRRISKIVGTDAFSYYYNQQWQVLEIRKNGNANPWKQYVYHPQYVDSIALRYYDENTDGNVVEHYYLQDANFNVTAVADNTGTVVERYAYTPYGEVTVRDADFSADADGLSDIANELLYTGRRLDPETGLQLNRNRFYHQQLGRWVNRDPIGYLGGMNLYGYVESMPTVRLDSSGLKTLPVPRPITGPITGPGGSSGFNPRLGPICLTFCNKTVDPIFDPITKVVLPKFPRKCRRNPKCSPCEGEPPRGGVRTDRSPPSRKHDPCPGDHTHVWHFRWGQNPDTCKCFPIKIEIVLCH